MKKLYLATLILLFSVSVIHAQTLSIDHPVLEYAGPENVLLASHATIVNSGSTSLDVLCKRTVMNLTPGHFTYFCWVVCYDSSTITSPDHITLAPSASVSSFEGWVAPMNIIGNDEVTYEYYDMNGNSDTLVVTYLYSFGPTGVPEISVSKYSFNITGSNPANSNATFTYAASGTRNASLLITNLLGSKVAEIPLNAKSGSYNLPLSDYKSGIYLCSLVADGTIVKSKKLIVAHR